MEFKEIVKERYATKAFTQEKLSQKQVDDLIELIRYAPSSWDIQTWRIKVVSDEDTLKKLYPATYGQPQILSCSHLLVFCAQTDLDKAVDDLEQMFIDKTGKKPTHIKMVRDSLTTKPKKEQICYAQRQVFLALGNALNGAKSLGFDSCPMGGFKADEYQKILNLPDNLIPTVICPIGYAADKQREKLRLDKEKILI